MRPFSLHQAKLFATQLTLKQSNNSVEKLGFAISTAKVDLNPHQVDAALFALQSPFRRGVILADEVGLGKTIEAGIVLCQKWAEGKRKILIITPASLRKQWLTELKEKFDIPSGILETKSFKEIQENNGLDSGETVFLCSYNFAASHSDQLKNYAWDLFVIDEAHRLRNVYKETNKMAKAIDGLVSTSSKLLLTATPLQNSLLELYGLVSIIDPHVFGDIDSFKDQYEYALEAERNNTLKERLRPFCQRTLRKQVLDYIQFTNRKAITQEFKPSTQEQELYDRVSRYLQRQILFALSSAQRRLITIILFKLLASSSFALGSTLKKILARLEEKRDKNIVLDVLSDEFEGLEEMVDEYEENEKSPKKEKLTAEDIKTLENELKELKECVQLAQAITTNTKGKALLAVLKKAFNKQAKSKAPQKVVVFTEFLNTQNYLVELLKSNGYEGKICILNSGNKDADSLRIYKAWCQKYKGTDKISGSKSADMKAAIVEYFKNEATILVATESAAEGINLQFCSLVVNYDLPWNPQRVEQRIGRCHRYGQKHDVVVVNFLNKNNEADEKVLELLQHKFKLFDGVFGASDEILGVIESGVDIEKKIGKIYQDCRTQQEIKEVFEAIQKELEKSVQEAQKNTRLKLLENLDETVAERLKISKQETQVVLDKRSKLLWSLAKNALDTDAKFTNDRQFELKKTPKGCSAKTGIYHLDWREVEEKNLHVFSENSKLAHWLIETALKYSTPSYNTLRLQYDKTLDKQYSLKPFIGKTGWVVVEKLSLQTIQPEEFIVIAAITDNGEYLSSEMAELLLRMPCQQVEKTTTKNSKEKLLKDKLLAQRKAILKDVEARYSEYLTEEGAQLAAWSKDLKLKVDLEVKALEKKLEQFYKKNESVNIDPKDFIVKEKKLKQEINIKKSNSILEQNEIDKQKQQLLEKQKNKLQIVESTTPLFQLKWQLLS